MRPFPNAPRNDLTSAQGRTFVAEGMGIGPKNALDPQRE